MSSIEAVPSIADYAAQINVSWRRTTDSVLETAKLCADAKRNYERDKKSFSKLKKALDFSISTFSKLVTIGENEALRGDDVKCLLPPNYSLVYDVAALKEDQLHKAIAEHAVSPAKTRAAFKEWCRRNGIGKAHAKDEAVALNVPIATLQVPPDYEEGKRTLLEQELEKLRDKFGFEIARPRDPEVE